MNYRIVAACAACAVLLTGCSGIPDKNKADNTAETRVVYQALPLPDIFMQIPEAYEETSSEFYDRYYLNDDASIIVTEDTEAVNQSVKDYSINAINQYKEMTKSFQLIGNETLTSGVLAVEMLEFEYSISEEVPPLTSMVGFVSDGQSVYILTCKCPSEHYESHREEFLSVLQSVRIDRAQPATSGE